MKKKLKVAVTGSIGSGKSEFCNYLESKGFIVIKADNISKEILANDKSVRVKVEKIFGEESFKSNEINRKYLAEKIFSIPENVLKINSILHPKVIDKVEWLLRDHLKSNDIVFVEAALIYEADMEYMFDYVVLITADYQTRMKRKIKSISFTEDEFKKRNENQIPDEEKKKHADFVFENNSTLNELNRKAELLIKLLV